MNIIAIWLVLVSTKLGLIVMCIYPHGSRVFMIVRALILLFLAARLTTVSLDKVLCERLAEETLFGESLVICQILPMVFLPRTHSVSSFTFAMICYTLDISRAKH